MEMGKSLLVQNAVELKERFNKAIAEEREIIIDHSGAEDFDITYLQILLSLDKYAAEKGIQLKFKGANPEGFINLINNCGLSMADFNLTGINSLEAGEGANG